MHFLKLIRIQNLLLIAFTQIVIRYFLIQPILQSASLDLLFTVSEFSVLVLSTILIAAGGYIINDYFDSGIDAINKPDKLYVGKYYSPKQALTFHTVFSVLGIILGLYVGAKVGMYKLAVIQAITVGLLWYYSAEFKRQFLIGNILIALLTALVPLLVLIFEMPLFISNFRKTIIDNEETFLLYKQIPLGMMQNINALWTFVGAFALFAFLLTFIREVVKDMQDVLGDKAFGRRTLPIKLGIKSAKVVASGFILITLAALAALIYKQIGVVDYFSSIYTLVFVEVPLSIVLVMLINATSEKQFARVSLMLKVLMFTGICYCFLFYWLMH
jgi:4-hydroxybenzoate polyprenyltransferase